MSIRLSSRVLLCGVWLWLTVALAAGQTHPPAPQAGPSPLAEAQALLAAGKADAAIAALRALPRAAADESQVNHLLGLAYYQKADYPHAVEHLTASAGQAKEGSAQYRQAVQLLGMSHYFLGHPKEAVTYLERVRGWAPDNTENACALGVSYLLAQDAENA